MTLKLGSTYHWNGHLSIVISLPDDEGSVAVVNFTSWEIDKDHTCVVEIGDHRFITGKTVIAYDFGEILTTAQQLDLEANAAQDEDVTEDLLERIQNGTDESEYTPEKVAKLVKESCRKQRAAKRASAPPVSK